MKSQLLSLEAVRKEVYRLASRLVAPSTELPTFGQSDHDGRPHVEVGDTYDWVVCERGYEFQRRKTLDLDELLYWVFVSATFSSAVHWELHNRILGQDGRRLIFKHQHELLTRLNPAWAARRDRELEVTLHDHPFNDDTYQPS